MRYASLCGADGGGFKGQPNVRIPYREWESAERRLMVGDMDPFALEDMDFDTLRALLAWQVELGATEAIGDLPVDRYEVSEPPPLAAAPAPAMRPDQSSPVKTVRDALRNVSDLEELRAALTAFKGCELKKGARNTVFADGIPGARIMVIGEAPGREEDVTGRPFVGRAGQLLDRMFAAIGMARDATPAQALYLTNIMPWRPPENRDLDPEEIAMMMPFVERHVELAKPEILVLMGNIACQAILGRKGITRMRGTWTTALDRPALPMFHPDYLLRNPGAKREAWHDLLMIQDRLGS